MIFHVILLLLPNGRQTKCRGEQMNFRKQQIVFVIFVAIVFSAVGFYGGFTLTKEEPTVEQNEPNNNNEEDKNNNESGSDNNNNQTTEKPKNLDKVFQAFDLIKEHYLEEIEDGELIEGAIQGMLGTLEDPYSSYMDDEATNRFTEQIESSFEGIGAEVSMVNGKVTIVAPIKDSPAEAVGLRPNDRIIKIDQESIDGLDLNEAVEKIRGERGTEVVLEIERDGTSENFEVTLIRDKIPIETVFASIEEVDGKKTGVLELTTFSQTTADEFFTELDKMEEEGIDGLVIDVRGNPGGLLNSIEDILRQFIPKDIPYIQTEDRTGEPVPFYSDLDEKKDYPISVLIDEGSASASEILAVAMKEVGYDVVGTPSFGKGTVQNAMPMGDNSTLKLTVYKWLSPEGNWIHDVGVEPTVEKKQPEYYYSNPIQVKDSYEFDDNDPQIANIQVMLNGIGYETDREDGYFDESTEIAVKKLQEDNDLDVTGVIDEDTAGIIETSVIERIREGKDDLQLEEALKVLYE